jgi:hypothetical protein
LNELTAQELTNAIIAHQQVMMLHIRALAAHCECLGMNAENCQRAMMNQHIVYEDVSYLQVMAKWGLINQKGEPIV